MIQDFSGKRVLVTGGGVGIGLGIVRAFARQGAEVAFTYFTHEPDGELLDELAWLHGSRPFAIRLDATDEQQVDHAMVAIVDAWRPGHLGEQRWRHGAALPLAQMRPGAVAQGQLDVNLTSCFLVTRAALAHLSDGGSIINVASLAGQNGGGQGAVAYATSKAAMFGFTTAMAKELAPRQIRVNAVAPGLILDTPFHEQFNTADGRAAAIEGIALKKPGLPADVAGPILWLADNEAAGFVTGTVTDINGGAYFS